MTIAAGPLVTDIKFSTTGQFTHLQNLITHCYVAVEIYASETLSKFYVHLRKLFKEFTIFS